MPHASAEGGQLPAYPSIENLKKQAKALLRAIRAAEPDALRRLRSVTAQPGNPDCIQLSNAQFVLAREHGFASWSRLKAAVADQAGASGAAMDDRMLPLVPLRDLVLYPGETLPIFVGRKKSMNAIKASLPDKSFLVCAQHDEGKDEPLDADLYKVGTLVRPREWVSLRDGTLRVMIEGKATAEISALDFSGPYIAARAEISSAKPHGSASTGQLESAKALFCRLVRLLDHPPALAAAIRKAKSADRLIALASRYFGLDLAQRQAMLECVDPAERLAFAVARLEGLESDLQAVRLGDYAGRYRLGPDFALEVSAEEGELLAATPWDRLRLRPQGRDCFRAVSETATFPMAEDGGLEAAMAAARATIGFRFFREASGEVSRVVRRDTTGSWPPASRIASEGAADGSRPSATAALRRHVGGYERGDGHERQVDESAGTLSLDAAELTQVDDLEFFAKNAVLRVLFKVNNDGHTVGMRVTSAGETHHYYKMA